MTKSKHWFIALFFTLLMSGCGGSVDVGNSQPGTLGVSLTDMPACGFDKVYVTVNKVRVHQSSSATEIDGGWTDIALDPALKIDLLSLNNGAFEHLGEASLAAGHYTQLRLVLDPNTPSVFSNSVVLSGSTTEIPLVTPSALQSGIKLINEFDVPSGQRVDLMIDFNACKSIVKRSNGNYALKPVIKVIPFMLNGIRGYIDPALYGRNVLVTAQQSGNVIQSTTPGNNGAFFLTRLVPGNYDVAITADGYTTAVIANVPIASVASIVDISTNSEPITLMASATSYSASGKVTLVPASTTEVPYVTGRQALGANPTVTVKSRAADDLTGDYSLILPIDAPSLGQFSLPLPIVFAAQSAVAGQYTLEASANGYVTSPSYPVNLSSGDTIQNFSLSLAPPAP